MPSCLNVSTSTSREFEHQDLRSRMGVHFNLNEYCRNELILWRPLDGIRGSLRSLFFPSLHSLTTSVPLAWRQIASPGEGETDPIH